MTFIDHLFDSLNSPGPNQKWLEENGGKYRKPYEEMMEERCAKRRRPNHPIGEPLMTTKVIQADREAETLKPCPFCGKSNVTVFGPYGWYHQWGISHSCEAFYSGTDTMMQGFRSEAQAIAVWNTRASHADPLRRALEEAVYAVRNAAEISAWSRLFGSRGFDHEDFVVWVENWVALHPIVQAVADEQDRASESMIQPSPAYSMEKNNGD